ncbi:MAG TPA: hypothetical protein ENN73_00705 [Firmicutes bacterium]|nr:hypothetical protein [Bacillota bacterium]
MKDLRGFILLLGLFTSVFSSLANNFFSVNMRYVTSGLTFWVFLGILSGLLTRHIKIDSARISDALKRYSIIFIFLSVLWGSVVIPRGYKLYKSDRELKRAVEYSKTAVTVNMQGSIFSAFYYYRVAYRFYLNSLKHEKNNVICNYFMGNLCQDAGELMVQTDRYLKEEIEFKQNISNLKVLISREVPGSMRRGDLEMKLSELERIQNEVQEFRHEFGTPAAAFEKALFYYDVVVKNSPYYVQIHYHKGRAFENLGRYPEARDEFEIYLRQNPVDFDAYFLLSDIYKKLGNSEKVDDLKQNLISEIEEDIRIFPLYLPLYFSLYRLYISEKNPEQAERVLLDMFTLPDIHLNKGFHRAIYFLYAHYINTRDTGKIDQFKKDYIFNNLKTF